MRRDGWSVVCSSAVSFFVASSAFAWLAWLALSGDQFNKGGAGVKRDEKRLTSGHDRRHDDGP
ncbi:hypothetical protein BDZ90DRAFT_232727 [Jaminaea rosea]|uniref:Uncharacterized protein n=1 Tax=Jaminaea rosea TaxID=1569628 RepID=A0A316UPE3_9BASI|nr:hypothetical protein BDZ90DRAFT_232727 [Jaminaea rosea]PWN27172.1 hypothetical protein BDZ90DRAFT_232727 [Jaminaea rosea]